VGAIASRARGAVLGSCPARVHGPHLFIGPMQVGGNHSTVPVRRNQRGPARRPAGIYHQHPGRQLVNEPCPRSAGVPAKFALIKVLHKQAYDRSGGWPHPLVEGTVNVDVHKGTDIYNFRRPSMRQDTLPLSDARRAVAETRLGSELSQPDLTRGFVVPTLAREVWASQISR
jgi:hypothetical protein